MTGARVCKRRPGAKHGTPVSVTSNAEEAAMQSKQFGRSVMPCGQAIKAQYDKVPGKRGGPWYAMKASLASSVQLRAKSLAFW